MINQLQQLKQ